MNDYSSERRLDVDAERAWIYLSDVSHLPEYFTRMTSAEQVGPDEVHTTARVELPDGTREVEGTAWFRRPDTKQVMEWGSEGANNYHGRLAVTDDGEGCLVRVEIHTESGHDGIEDGIEDTLDAITAALT